MDSKPNSVTHVEQNETSLIPAAWDGPVRTLRAKDIPEAGRALAHSFATDPLSLYLLGGDNMVKYSGEKRWKLHLALMTTTVATHHYGGVVTVSGPDHDSLALWITPGKACDNWWIALRSGTWKLLYKLPSEARYRFLKEMHPLLHHTKEEVMGERDSDCYYLVYIRTKPNARGRGHAAKLLRNMIEKADAENRPMYLESSCLKNNSYYAKFGFEFKKEIVFRRGPEPLIIYAMVREPQHLKLDYASSDMLEVSEGVKA